MKNLLKKLHIVADQSDEASSPPTAADLPQRSEHKALSGLQGWLNSVAGRNSLSTSPPTSTNVAAATTTAAPAALDAVRDGDGAAACSLTVTDAIGLAAKPKQSVMDEEESQIQLALELSAREDPEAVQIEAVKQISLGSSCPPQNSPAEVIAFRYWNYNALGYDDKILDGFYDLYGVLPESNTVKMPSLVDLQGTPMSDSIRWEAVLVNRPGDPDLIKLEQKVLVMALESKSGSLGSAGRYLVQKLAMLVANYMGGAVGDDSSMLRAWRNYRNKLGMSLGNVVMPLGRLTVGLARHRALLFKVLADSVGIPCQLVKGKLYTGSDDGAMNIVKLNDGRECVVNLMTDPGTLISSDAAGTQKESDDDFFALSPSLTDIESFHVISCSSSGSSSISCSFSNETADKRSSCQHLVTSESDGGTLGMLQDEENQKPSNSADSSTEAPNDKSKVSNDLRNQWYIEKMPAHELSLKASHPHALARSPSWTEGISFRAARRMKVKDVSQYMIDATKENPQLAQKLHDVLVESGVFVPPNLFTEICSEEQETPISKGRNTSDHKNETERGERRVNAKSRVGGSLGLYLPCLPEDRVQPKVTPPRSQMEHLKPVVGLGVQHPQGIEEAATVSSSSQSEESPVQQLASPMKLMDNMPVAAAVATVALVASSMVVSATKSSNEAKIEVPVAAAAATATAAAVVATTAAVSMQQKHLNYSSSVAAISPFKNTDFSRTKCEEGPLFDEQKESHGQDSLPEREQESSEIHQEAERNSDRSVGAESVKSDTSLDDVAEFEIPWEEIILGERIGLGSYGEVYGGEWHGTEVAVKRFLDQDISGDALEEFKSEIRIMKRVRHPNVVLFMGAVTRVPNLSIVTEFLPRGSLFRLIHRPNNQLDERRRLRMALDIARGMNYLHNCSPVIVHRDLKSPNLLVDKNWVVKVCDFGLSRMKHSTFLSSRSTAGTAEWMAPEILRNEPSDEKCDVYSFGVILWELCTLQQPWGGMNPMQVVGAVGFQHRRLDIPDDIDPAIADIIMQCWQTDSSKRPSFSNIMAQLKPLQKPTTNTSQAMKQRILSSGGTE